MSDQARATGRCGDTSTTSTDVIVPLTVCALPYGHQGWHCADNGAEWSREPASTADRLADEWPALRDRMLRDERVRGAYEDCNNEAPTCLALTAARKNADMTRQDVAAWIAHQTGMSSRRARRWVNRYESGELGGNTPTWLLHVYGRAVGTVVHISVGAPNQPQEATR